MQRRSCPLESDMLERPSRECADADMATAADPAARTHAQSSAQRLPMTHELFSEGNLRRELLAKQTAISRSSEPVALSNSSEVMDDARLWECMTCGLQLLTARQLDLHVEEVHDSFFQAQAARSMKVFRCVVEGCNKRFTTPAERRQHLADFHRFPWGLYYDSIHLGPKSNAGHPSRPQHAPESGAENTSALEARGREGERGAADDGKAASACAEVDSLIGGMSKLSSCDSEVPRVATFGRRNRHRAFS